MQSYLDSEGRFAKISNTPVVKSFFGDAGNLSMNTHPELRVGIFDNSANEIAEHIQKGEAGFGVTIMSTIR